MVSTVETALGERTVTLDQKLSALLVDILQISPAIVTDDLAMAGVESWDSLRHMELISSIEDTFECELTFEEIVAMRTVREIKRILSEKRGLD